MVFNSWSFKSANRFIQKTIFKGLIFVIAILVALYSALYTWQPSKTDALETAKMILFWDGGAAPTNWTDISSSNSGKFIRGEAPGSVSYSSGDTLSGGGTADHSPSIDSTTQNTNNPTGTSQQAGGSTINVSTHTHGQSGSTTITDTGDSDNNPLHRTLKLIRYDGGGIPTTIPSGAIALFDDSPGIPGADWSAYTDNHGRMIKTSTSVGNGGSDTHAHDVSWPSFSGTAGTIANSGTGTLNAIANHTHNAPSSSSTSTDTCGSTGCLPPYVKPLIAKATANTSAPNGMIALFDANPGGGWAVQSNPGSTFYQQFLRPASTFDGNTAGSSTHSHANLNSGSSACVSGCSTLQSSTTQNGGSRSDHTHTWTADFADSNNTPEYINLVIAEKSLPAMLLFWDGKDHLGNSISVPSGWTEVSSDAAYLDKFPRGNSPGNAGDNGGSTAHTHTNQSVAVDPNSSLESSALISASVAAASHTHSAPSVNTINTPANSNIPVYRTLRLIKYNSGIPSTIPKGGMTIFDNSPGIPGSGWTQVSAQNANMIRISSTAESTGGADTHTHTVTWSGSLGASSGSANGNCVLCGGGQQSAANGHTHSAPGSTTSASGSNVPPYIQSLLAKANADTATLTVGLTSMFDGDPGSGWVIQSSSGGKYYRKFIRPNSTYSEAGGGADNHTHTATGTSGTAANGSNNSGGTGVARGGHTHPVTGTFYTGSSDPLYTGDAEGDYFLPPFVNVVIAEKVDFRLDDYAWYEDSNGLDVTDRWSTLDVAENTAIPTLPTAYKPPAITMELRLRVKILVNNNDLLADDISYKIQFKKGTDASCTTGSWTDVGVVGGGEIWRFASSSVTDGDPLQTPASTYSRLSPTSSVMQVYAKSNPTATNPNAVSAGSTMEYDFHIEHNGAEGATQYSFRVVEVGDILLSEYTVCPTLVTKPASVDQLRHGNFFEESGTGEHEAGFSWAD